MELWQNWPLSGPIAPSPTPEDGAVVFGYRQWMGGAVILRCLLLGGWRSCWLIFGVVGRGRLAGDAGERERRDGVVGRGGGVIGLYYSQKYV